MINSMLKGQDIVVLLALIGRDDPTVRALAESLGWDPAGVHRSLKRLAEARLYEPARSRAPKARIEEFLIHGVPYVFPASLGQVTRGMPTAWAAEPLAQRLAPTDELPPVWPDPRGLVRGSAFEPLHAIAIEGSKRDAHLYERLTLVDAIRGGDARSRNLAAELLKEDLK
jgi:hypothetical protein